MKKHNFSAGPSILPDSVFKEASQAVIDFNGSGLSILEMSHRSKDFVAVMDQATSLSLELLGLENKGYHALFLQGGASLQFVMLAQNLLENKAAYLNTGTWANNAIKEARFFGEVVEVASSKDKNYNYIPKNYEIPDDVDYFHCTSNNTIFGTQIKEFPKTSVPMICDMSSDIFSRALDYSQFDLIYAGAQKNMGPAGTTLVIIKESILGKVSRAIPNILNYTSHIEKESIYNTPSVFAVYVSMLTLKWLKAKGGVTAMEVENTKKADLLYNEIDRNSLFEGFVSRLDDRSFMNATFNLTEESSKELFESMLKEAGISGLNGHRSVGGYRASIYNAMPIESVEVLVEVMQELENRV